MTDLQQSRYDQLLRRVGDLKGSGSKVNDVLSELFPTIDVENVPGELLLLMATQLCIGAAQVTAAAGERPRIQLFNPVGSGKIIAVSSCIFSNTATATMAYAVTNNALTTGVGTETFRDGRLGQAARPSGQIRTDSTIAITDSNGLVRLLASVSWSLEDINTPAVLAPGNGFEVGSQGTQDTILVTFNWRERVAEPSEINF